MCRQLSRGDIHKESIADHLCEFMWRRRVQKLGQDPFKQLLRHQKVLSGENIIYFH